MKELIKSIIDILNDKLAEDVVMIDFNGSSSIADYFIIVTAKNYRHANSLVDFLCEYMDENGIVDYHINNTKDSGWLVVDINDIVVHIFLKEERDKYQLEKLWSDQIILKM